MKSLIVAFTSLALIALSGCQTSGTYMVFHSRKSSPDLSSRLAPDLTLLKRMGDDARLLGFTRDGWMAVEGNLESIQEQENVFWNRDFDPTLIIDPGREFLLLTDKGLLSLDDLPDGVAVRKIYPQSGLVVLLASEPITGKLVADVWRLSWARYVELNHLLYRD